MEPSCLACHGTKANRPAFVMENYPDDKVFDFKVGDLRGMDAVFIPELEQALAVAAPPEAAVGPWWRHRGFGS
nr:DUF3365 domain-containing protein [Synechococcus sp. RedBA-s]